MALLPSEERETISLTVLSSVCRQLPSGEPLPKPEGTVLRDWVSQTLVSWSGRFGAMTQLAKLLPRKHENPSLLPRTHIKKLDVVVSAHRRALRGEAEPSGVRSHLGLQSG